MRRLFISGLIASVSVLTVNHTAVAGSATVLGGLINSASPTPAQIQAAQEVFGTTNPTIEQTTSVQTATNLQNSSPALSNVTPQVVLQSATTAAANAFNLPAGTLPTPAQVQIAQAAQSFFGVLQPTPQQVQGVQNIQNLLAPPGSPSPTVTVQQTQALLTNLGITINSNATVTITPPPPSGSPQAQAFQAQLTNLFPNEATRNAVSNALSNLASLFN